MAFPDDWAYRCSLDLAQADATLADWTYLINEQTLPAQIFQEAIDGGGDIRFSSDQEGTTQIPCHIRTFDSTGSKADIAVRIPSLSGSASTRIWIWWMKSGETQPTPSDTYGQYNAYDSDHLLVWPLNDTSIGSADDIIDATSNQNHATSVGITGTAAGEGLFGGALTMNANGEYARAKAAVNLQPCTCEALYRSSSISSNQQAIVFGARAGMQVYSSELRTVGNSWSTSTGLSMVQDQWYHCATRSDGAFEEAVLNGVSGGQNTGLTGSNSIAPAIGTSTYSLGTQSWHGTGDEIRISGILRTDAWLLANYANQITPLTFTIVGTPEAVIGRVDTTVTATNAAGSDIETFTWTEIPPPG